MLSTPVPPRFPIPFANAAGPDFIRPVPTASQIGIQDGAASLTDGFPPDCFTPIPAGGTPPFGQDMNGLMKQVTQWLQWVQAGGAVPYDAAFATAIGGYPKGAIVRTAVWSSGTEWLSTVDNNTGDPDSFAANWVQNPGQIPIGSPVPFMVSQLPFGYVPANGGTIGNSGSNASLLTNNTEAWLLFYQIWIGYPNSQCPVLNSSGVPVGRGINAAADFNANNQMVVPDLRGRGLTGIDTMLGGSTSRLAGVPLVAGALTVAGSVFGENLHQLLLTELASHAHANSLNDPTHDHGISDPTHSHANSLNDPTHIHSVAVTDPTHTHTNTITRAQFNISTAGVGPFLYGASIGGGAGGIIDLSATGITAAANAHSTGVTISNAAAGTGISVSAHSTGMSISNAAAGGDGSHNNVAQSMGVIWGLKT